MCSASGRGRSARRPTAGCAAWPRCLRRDTMTVGNAGRGPGAERNDMGDHRGIHRARAERLLAGTDPGTDPLGRLLAAARAPGTPAELRGEAAALGAFRIGATREP